MFEFTIRLRGAVGGRKKNGHNTKRTLRMFRSAMKLFALVATSVVAVPYTLAVVSNLLYGWPLGPDRFQRALRPRKVLALNKTLLQHLLLYRYAPLWFKWKRFYRNAPEYRLLKDFRFGSHGNSLDIYLPELPSGSLPTRLRPVIVFVYGGAWGSGDKSDYGLVCAELADQSGALVCCPNYSIYPRGYVDDMVQDVVDCVAWLQDHAREYGADKDRVILIGHSAGAHLCALAALELTLQQLLTNPHPLLLGHADPSQPALASLKFEDSHFNGGCAASAISSLNTGSFCVVDNGSDARSSNASDSFYVVGRSKEEDSGPSVEEEPQDREVEPTSLLDSTTQGDEPDAGRVESEPPRAESAGEEAESGPGASIDEEAPLSSEQEIKEDGDMSSEVNELLVAVKAVIGLAGVYDITDHYLHEAGRGVEDISTMAKAMYSPEHFQRFSPAVIVQNLPQRTRLPPFTLIHGTGDWVVPVSSSSKMANVLQQNGGTRVNNVHIPDCDHYALCLDIMDPTSRFHDVILDVIKRELQVVS